MFPSLKAHTSDHLLVFPLPFFRFHLSPSSKHYLFCFLLSLYSSPPFSSSIQRNRNLESICRWPLSLAPRSSVHELSHRGAMEENWGVGRNWGVLHSEKSLLFVKTASTWEWKSERPLQSYGFISILSWHPRQRRLPWK